MSDYLYNKKPDWWPKKIDGLLGKRGQITVKALQKLSYWEKALIGFNDPKKQKAWMLEYSAELKEHHKFMRHLNAKSQIYFIDKIIEPLELKRAYLTHFILEKYPVPQRPGKQP